MTTESTSSVLSSLPIHRVDYAVLKPRPFMLPRRSSTSLNLESSVEVNREIRRYFSKRPINNEDANFLESTKIRRSIGKEKENESHAVNICNRKTGLHKWSHVDIKRDRLSAARSKLPQYSQLLPAEDNKKLHSVRNIKPLSQSETPRVKPSRTKKRSATNTPLTDSNGKSTTYNSKDVFKSNALMNQTTKQPASRNMNINMLKTKNRNILLPQGKNVIFCNRNDHNIKCEFCKVRSGGQLNNPYHAAVETSIIKLKSVSQYQVKQKYRRSSLHLKPFSLFFRKKSSENGSSVQVDLTSAVKCIKTKSISPEKVLRNSAYLTGLCQNNVVGPSPITDSSLTMFITKSSRKKYPSLRECKTSSKNYNQLMSSKNMCQLKPESPYKMCIKKSEDVSSIFDVKSFESKSILEHNHDKKILYLTEKKNCKSKSAQLFKSKLLLCESQCVSCKYKSNKSNSFRKCPQRYRGKHIATGSQQAFEHALYDNEKVHDDEAVCLRHYIKESPTKDSAVNITSSFNLRINLSDVSHDIINSKRPEHENKTILRPATVSFHKKEPTFNRVLEPSSISYLRGVCSRLFPITSTKKYEKNILKEKTVSQKISFNGCNQNLNTLTQHLIDKDVPGGKSKIIKIQNIEHGSVLKRCFGFIFNKLMKDDSAEAHIPKIHKNNVFKNECKKLDNKGLLMKKSPLELPNLKQSTKPVLRKNTICRSDIMNEQDNIMYSTKTGCKNIGYSAQQIKNKTGPNECKPPNCQKNCGRENSNFSFNVKLYENSGIGFNPYKIESQNYKSNEVNTRKPSQLFCSQGVQKTYMINPTVMSLVQTKYTNDKSETYKYLTNTVDKKPDNILFDLEKPTMRVESLKNDRDFTKSKTNYLRAKKLLNPNNSRKHHVKYYSTSNTSIQVPSNKISRLKLNTYCGNKKWNFIPLRNLPSKPRTKKNNLKKISLTKTGTIENSTNVFGHKNKKNEITSAYCHVTYDRAGNATCERLITCAPQCKWIHKKGKRVKARPHVIESFCPFEDRNFMIQPCVTQTQEDNERDRKVVTFSDCARNVTGELDARTKTTEGISVKARPQVIGNTYPFEKGNNILIQPCMIQTQEDNKEDKKIKKTANIISHLFKKKLGKKTCDCVCSSGDARKNNTNSLKPKFTIEVDTNKMNIKNREEVLKRAIKLKKQEISELGANFSQSGNKSPCCCTGSEPKSLKCMSCKNIPHRPNVKQALTMKNMQNKPLLEIKMDSDSNILNRADVLERIQRMKYYGQSTKGYSDTNVDADKMKIKFKNILAGRPTCVCNDDVCFRESEKEHMKKEEAKKKEKPCICGAPSCDRISVLRLVKEGKLSKEDGRSILEIIKKQEVMKKKELLREQKEKVMEEREKLKKKHLQILGKSQPGSKKKTKIKSKKKGAAKLPKGKLTKEELKALPKDQRELVKKSVKKQSSAQIETEKIRQSMQKQKLEDKERKVKETMEERKVAAGLEQKFKRQMIADDRKEKKKLRKSQFAERIKRAKEKRYKNMRAQKKKKHEMILKQKEILKDKIEYEELKKQKEKQQIQMAEKVRKHKEQVKKKKKSERKKKEKKKMKKQRLKLKLKLLKQKKKRAAMLKKKKLKEKKAKMARIRKENERFLKKMHKLAAMEKKERMKEAEKKHQLKLKRHAFMRQEIKKYKEADDRYLVLESLKEVGACCVKYTGKLFDFLSYSARHPQLTYKKMRRAYLQPDQVASEMRKDWSESEVHDIANRIEAKILAIDRLQPIGKKLYDKPKKKKLPKHRFKKRKRNRRAPMDFGCSLYMASLRNKPYFILYWMCPWFYPHLISMLKVLRQLADAGLFILAAFVWSPLILLWELFRTIMCCGLCTA